MFVYYYVHVRRPFIEVERRLLDDVGELNAFAVAAYREGEEIRAKIGVGGSPPLIAKTVGITVGSPIERESQTIVPVSWQATGTPGLFPSMEGDLVVAPLGPDVTHVAYRGSYRPPLGSVGNLLDRHLLHRVAEASVKGFVDRIGDALQRGAAGTASS